MDSDLIQKASLSVLTDEYPSPTVLYEQNISHQPLPVALKPRSQRNLKKLSLTIPATPLPHNAPATASLLPLETKLVLQPTSTITSTTTSASTQISTSSTRPSLTLHPPTRRASIVSLPPASSAALYRKDETESPSVPYRDGPIEVMPHLWIGDEDNARDWKSLRERGIKSILNVAKELPCPLQHHTSPLRVAQSTSNLTLARENVSATTYYPPHLPSGRPAFHYLKLPWSHGQTDLVTEGFPAAMKFVDEAMSRGDGILVHCQCGVSRSATLVIALVMRAASHASSSTRPDISALKGGGMHSAYAFVKEKSKWVGPNMSLIYQLLDYERALQSGIASPSSSIMSTNAANDEVEWGRKRQALEDEPDEATAYESSIFVHEAKALDQEMEDRKVARKSSQQSVASSSSGVPVTTGWRSRYGFPSLGRSRAGSISSNLTVQSSALGEEILEEDQGHTRFASGASPSTLETDEDTHGWIKEMLDTDSSISLGVPTPKVPVSMSAFSSYKTQFNSLSRTRTKPKMKHRPPPLVNLLPPVPSSPLPVTVPLHEPSTVLLSRNGSPTRSSVSLRSRNYENRRLSRGSTSSHSSIRSSSSAWSSSIQSTSQTLLIFPSEDTSASSTVMLTATPSASSFSLPPRISNLSARKKSCLNMGVVATPTTAFSFVEVKGINITTPQRQT